MEPATDVPETCSGSAIARILQEPSRTFIGVAGELCAPIVDVRGWYVLAALDTADRTIGLLYVDGHRSRTPREWEAGFVGSLTAIAGVSLHNSILFARTRELALRDPLTGLFNRRAFSERLSAEIDTARRYGRSLAYALMDVDDFKRINDTFGHARGDAVLVSLAQTLARTSRAQDVIGRFAGDEFTLLLVDVRPAMARTLVSRLSRELRRAGLACSIGVATFPHDADDAAGLLVAADRALYATKAAGKDGFSFASSYGASG